MKTFRKTFKLFFEWTFVFLMGYVSLNAQNILIDKPVAAGPLTVFPDMANPNSYYYLANKLRLGIGTNGKPQFSFLRFVENERTEAGEASVREGKGGGIVHALVELYVSEDMIKEAQQELKRATRNENATLIGPIIYKSGTMALVSSIANEKGGYSKMVVGLGPAPVLAGNKAAVSVLLTKEGAKILWETFKTPTPDLSFSFVMSVVGYRSPINAKIEVDFDKVYTSSSLNIGFGLATGGGTTTATNPKPDAKPTPANSSATAAVKPEDTKIAEAELKTAETDVSAAEAELKKAEEESTEKYKIHQLSLSAADKAKEAMNASNVKAADKPKLKAAHDLATANEAKALKDFNDAYEKKESIETKVKQKKQTVADLKNKPKPTEAKPAPAPAVTASANGNKPTSQPSNSKSTAFTMDAQIKLAFEEMRQTGAIKVSGAAGDAQLDKVLEIAYNKLTDMMFEKVDNSNQQVSLGSITDAANKMNAAAPDKPKADGSTSINLSVAYQLKEIRRTGKFTVDLNRSLSDQIDFRFDDNFGRPACDECFRQINLDDPMFRQREIQVSLDGLNSDQFKKYINFATVSMKKIHGNDDITADEVRIGPADFEKNANVYRLLYGWKDAKDADKNKWLQYEYKTTWSLFGDYTIQGDWKPSEAFGLNIAPPVRTVKIDIEASPDLLKAAEVRMVNVKFYYNYGGGEKVQQVNIRADQATTAATAELLLPQNVYDYDYEISWRLTGNREVKSGRKKSNYTMLYVDELPK